LDINTLIIGFSIGYIIASMLLLFIVLPGKNEKRK